MSPPNTPADPDREAIKAAFLRERGYWRPWVETLLRERPRFVQAYADYAGHPARTGPLSVRMVELLYVALDASGSHLFEAGLRTHMVKALEAGATQADLFDVLHLVAAQGLEAVVDHWINGSVRLEWSVYALVPLAASGAALRIIERSRSSRKPF